MSDDAELDELERLEALVRGPGWVPDIDKGPDYEEWTGKWYTPTRPDGTGGRSLSLYADDEELLYARYIASLRNAAPRLIRAARHLAALDSEGLVAENEALRRRVVEVERERDEQLERNANAKQTVLGALDLAEEYHAKRDALHKLLGARWNESLEEAAERLSADALREQQFMSDKTWRMLAELEAQVPNGRLYTLAGIAYGHGFDSAAAELKTCAALLGTDNYRAKDAVAAIRTRATKPLTRETISLGPEQWFYRAAVAVIDARCLKPGEADAVLGRADALLAEHEGATCAADPQAPGRTPQA